jgi:hypothetical protein
LKLKNFREKESSYRHGHPLTSLVKIDSAHQRILVGDAQTRQLAMLDANGKILGLAPMESPPVDLIFRPDGYLLTLIGSIFPSDEFAPAHRRDVRGFEQ